MARRRRGMSQETLYHIDTPPAPPSAPQVSFQKFYLNLLWSNAKNQIHQDIFSQPLWIQFPKVSYQPILVALPKRLDIQIEDFQSRDSWTIRGPLYFTSNVYGKRFTFL